MDTFDRITVEPAVMNGQPTIRTTRVTVRRMLAALAIYPDRAEHLRKNQSCSWRTSLGRMSSRPAISMTWCQSQPPKLGSAADRAGPSARE